MQKILFVINTLSRAGAETALLELLRRLQDRQEIEVDLLVLTGIGEMQKELPDYVRVRNKELKNLSVLTEEGRKELKKLILRVLFGKGQIIRQFPYMLKNGLLMLKNKAILPDKLLWRALAYGTEALPEEYDLAVAYLEGGSTYYVADRVKAKKKVAFVHVDYQKAGYSRGLDKDAYSHMDRVYCVSQEVADSFIKAYPEHRAKTQVFANLLGRERIRQMAEQPGGFGDVYSGLRILTIGRLTKQKAFEVSIEAMKRLKDKGLEARWYVLGEGDQRKYLEEMISQQGLEKEFLLLGNTINPYPYLRQADLYVHASRFEGKSIAVQEAQILGKPILVTDCQGNREQVQSGQDGLMCDFDAEKIAAAVLEMAAHPDQCQAYGQAAAAKMASDPEEEKRVKELLLLAGCGD